MSSPVHTSLEALVGQVADEYTERANRGERPSVEEYVAKYPLVADVLRQVLPAIQMLQQPEVEGALAETDPYLGKTLGDFRLVRRIDQGGMGIVYEARQISLDRRVAVKILPEASALDPRRLQRFKIEAQAAASLNHEHIVPVYFVGCENGVHFYAMQYIDGPSLANIIKTLRSGARPHPAEPDQTATYGPREGAALAADSDTMSLTALTTAGSRQSPEYFQIVARLGLEAAKGLEYAHQQVIWHRDIKPANLLVDSRGSLWIADFGLAQIRSQPELTVSGELVGTLRYMSPEQAMGHRVPIDHRTDVYSLGATLYELVTLEPVFSGNDRAELLRQVMFDDPRPLRCLNPRAPRDLETILHKALSKAPAQRYSSAKALAEDLHRFLNDQPIKARPEGLPRWLWRRSRRQARTIALGMAVLTTVVLLLLLLVQLNQPSSEELARIRQQEALTALTQELESKQKATLIGNQGRPNYFVVRTSQNPAKTVDAPDGAFTVQDWDHGLIELLPSCRLARYRFRAEVRHERQINFDSKAGIYFAHGEQRNGDTVAHSHYNLAFNDLVDVGAVNADNARRGNSVGLEGHCQPALGVDHYMVSLPNWVRLFAPARPIGAPGPWRKIAIEVRPNSVKTFWEGNSIANTPRKELRTAEMLLNAMPGPAPHDTRPKFVPGDGLGLFVSLGVASFRNVTIEAIGDEN